MNEQEIIARLEAVERRLEALENTRLEAKETKKEQTNENFSGLAGGIRRLIKNGFLNSPKEAKEIKEELKREGYHYTDAGITSTLTETFVKNKRVLTRIDENKHWKYTIRK
jgi:3-phosphoglycerate kinase